MAIGLVYFVKNNMETLEILYIELTNMCNCACLTCPKSLAKDDRPKGYMDFNLFCSIIKQAHEITGNINISYFGEHSLHPRFFDIMDVLSKRDNIGVTFYTNFLGITKKHIDSIINAKINTLAVSIDASNPEIYDKLRYGKICSDLQGNTFSENRLPIVEEKLRYWFGRSDHIETRLEFTISHYNIGEVKQFVEKWTPRLSKKDYVFTKVVLTYGGKVLNEQFLLKNNCEMWEDKILVIAWDGRIGTCYLDTNMDLCLGDVNNIPIKDFMNSNRFNEIKRLSKNKEIEPCKFCIDASNRKMDRVFKKDSKWTEECDKYIGLF